MNHVIATEGLTRRFGRLESPLPAADVAGVGLAGGKEPPARHGTFLRMHPRAAAHGCPGPT